MATRSIKEVQSEIQKTKDDFDYLVECAGLYQDERGYWQWRNPLIIRYMNENRCHLHNLYLELNRAKQKTWKRS